MSPPYLFVCVPIGDGQVDFEEFVTLLGPKLTAAGVPDTFNGTDFDSVFWKVIADLLPAYYC